jgi:ABC-type bacteriocin/lantibiotic exporter with double-glycine peptidase domain
MTSTLGPLPHRARAGRQRIVMWLGGHAVLAHGWTVGDYFSYNMFLAFMIAPVFQIVNIGTQLTEAFAGLDRTTRFSPNGRERRARPAPALMPPIKGDVQFEMSSSPTSRRQARPARH